MNTRTVLLITLVTGIYSCKIKTKNTLRSKREIEEKSKTSELLKLETFYSETFPMNKKDKSIHRLADSWYFPVPTFSSLVKDAPGTFWSKRGIEVNKITSTLWKLKTLDSEKFLIDIKDKIKQFPIPPFSSLVKYAHGKERAIHAFNKNFPFAAIMKSLDKRSNEKKSENK